MKTARFPMDDVPTGVPSLRREEVGPWGPLGYQSQLPSLGQLDWNLELLVMLPSHTPEYSSTQGWGCVSNLKTPVPSLGG